MLLVFLLILLGDTRTFAEDIIESFDGWGFVDGTPALSNGEYIHIPWKFVAKIDGVPANDGAIETWTGPTGLSISTGSGLVDELRILNINGDEFNFGGFNFTGSSVHSMFVTGWRNGVQVTPPQIISYSDSTTDEYFDMRSKSNEFKNIDEVRICGSDLGGGDYDKISGFLEGLTYDVTPIIDEVSPTAPTEVTVTPVGGTIIANSLNKSNTNMTATATITAAEATGGRAELYVDGVLLATDNTIAIYDTQVIFDLGISTTDGLQAAVVSGGIVRVKLYDDAGNSSTSLVDNPTLTVDYLSELPAPPTATVQPITGTLQVGETLTGHYTYSDINGDLEGTSTYKWYKSDNAAGLNKTEIAGANAKTYVLQSADIGKYISFEVIPVALTGIAQGIAVESAKAGAIVPAEAAPTATVQPITGTLQVGETLTGNYTYSDINGDLEGTSTYKWYRSDNAAGLNKTEIVGATATTYVLMSADIGKYISFEVTPVASTGIAQGTAVESAKTGVIVPAEAAPTVTVQPITGTLQVGETLTGHYTYSDVNGDLEGTSTYKWYRSDNAAGLNKTEIVGATATTYVLTSADIGKYISFEVTPVALTGIAQGIAVESAKVGSITTQLSQVTGVALSSIGVASWTDIANESFYEVQLYKNGETLVSNVTKPADTTSHDFLSEMRSSGVGTYTVKVVAKGDGTTHLDAPTSSSSTNQTVTKLAIVDTATWDGNVAKWTAVSDADSYEVTLYKDGIPIANTVTTDTVTGVNFSTTLGTNGAGTYTYKVTAKADLNAKLVLDANPSAASGGKILALPGAPTGISATAGDSQAVISFIAPDNIGGSEITGYTVKVYKSDGTPLSLLNQTALTSPITITGLSNGTSYKFKVVATNLLGNGLESSETSVITPSKVPDAPTGISATAGNGQATIIFTQPDNGGSDITGYKVKVYVAGVEQASLNKMVAATSITTTPANVNVTGLTNGTAYTFKVIATNGVGDSILSDSSSAITPMGTQVAPTSLIGVRPTTTANNDGKITGVTSVMEYKLKTATIWIPVTGTEITGLVAGEYEVRYKATSNANPSPSVSVVIPGYIPASGGSSTPPAADTKTDNVNVIVNGKEESIGKAETSIENNQTQIKLTVDEIKLQEKLDTAGNNATVIFPIMNTQTDIITGELNGQMVKNMEDKQATLIIQTTNGSYTLPASQINIDAISKQMGQNVNLKDIKIQIDIEKPKDETVKVVENAAQQGDFSLVIPPVNFKVTYTSGDKSGEVARFNAYVERTIAIPNGVNPNKVTTGIVVNPDGTIYHVPTKVIQKDGKYYAVINSLTNSTYAVVWSPKEFTDLETHWAKDSINNLGSRMVINGVNENTFDPDNDITRAQFVAIMVRGLGLKPGVGENTYSDVAQDTWYTDYIKTATDYKLIKGYENGNFGATDKITRQQAFAIIARAMVVTELSADLTEEEINTILAKYSDANSIANYAREYIALAIQTGVVNGRSNQTLSPRDYITRAEVAVIIERLLKKSELID